MYHVAIMKKSWGLLKKIANGEKTVESRWYKTKRAPWDEIAAGDMVYFKNSGEAVTLRASVERVLQFSELTPRRVRAILLQYGRQDGIASGRIPAFYRLFRDKRYCILIFLRTLEHVTPFHIDKTGFGAMSAWITCSHINQVRTYK